MARGRWPASSETLRAARIERDLSAILGVVSARASARTGRVLVRVGGGQADEAAVLGAHAAPGAPPPPSARRAAGALAEGVGAPCTRRVAGRALARRGGRGRPPRVAGAGLGERGRAGRAG